VVGYGLRAVPTVMLRIRAERDRIVRFLLTGVCGALLNVALFVGFHRGLGVDYRIAVVLAYGLSYVFSFVVNRSWTFAATDGHAGRQAVRFVLVSAVATGAALAFTIVAVEAGGLPKNVAEAGSALLAAPLAFALHRRITFAAAPEPA
jgi:putative flippase GtrA